MINTRKLIVLCVFSIIPHSLMLPKSGSAETQQLAIPLPSTDTKVQKSRMRKSSGKKEKKIRTYRDMSYEQLSHAKNQHIANKNSASAIKYLEQMIKLCDPENVITIAEHLLEIADLVFAEGQFQKAGQRYAEFALLNPGSNRLEYSLYKATVSSFNCMLSYDRDQTKTEETLALAEKFLQQEDFVTYTAEVEIIAQQCVTKLVESELSICSYYLKRGRLKPAEKRLSLVRTHLLPKLPSMETLIVALENDLAVQKDEIIKVAQKNIVTAHNKQAKRMTDRF